MQFYQTTFVFIAIMIDDIKHSNYNLIALTATTAEYIVGYSVTVLFSLANTELLRLFKYHIAVLLL